MKLIGKYLGELLLIILLLVGSCEKPDSPHKQDNIPADSAGSFQGETCRSCGDNWDLQDTIPDN